MLCYNILARYSRCSKNTLELLSTFLDIGMISSVQIGQFAISKAKWRIKCDRITIIIIIITMTRIIAYKEIYNTCDVIKSSLFYLQSQLAFN